MYALGLAHAGCRALTATDIASAEETVESEPPNAVVTELQLPARDGWALIHHLQGDPRTRLIPIVVVTALVDRSIDSIARSAGCAGVLRKPCPPDVLAGVPSLSVNNNDLWES